MYDLDYRHKTHNRAYGFLATTSGVAPARPKCLAVLVSSELSLVPGRLSDGELCRSAGFETRPMGVAEMLAERRVYSYAILNR